MGNFLTVIPAPGCTDEASRLFSRGLDYAREFFSQGPSRALENEWIYAASFPRQNGSGAPIVDDSRNETWLLASGTWFHSDGYASGDELRLLRRYSEVTPVQLARELEGFFTLIIGDHRKREAVVLTDIVGSCHSFLRLWKQGVAFSSSSLLLATLDGYSLDPVGCQEFLYTGIIYEDRTCYTEVRKLAPATVFRFKEGALKSAERYWKIGDVAPESLDGRAAASALWHTIVDAAQRVARAFPQPVCDLTGGYDSRVIVGAFLEAGVRCTTAVSGPAKSPDVLVSRGLARELGLPHLYVEPPREVSWELIQHALSLTDGESDLVAYSHVLQIHRALSEQFQISINGSFGEVARGYWWELLFPQAGACQKLDSHKVARLRYAAQPADLSIFPPSVRIEPVAHFEQIVDRTNLGLLDLPNTLQMDHAYLMMRMQRWQGRLASSTNRLWPCLSPFLFRSVLEVMLRVRARLRRRGLLVREMLAEFQPQLAQYPLEHGYPALPVTWKTAPRFWPVPLYYGRKILQKGLRSLGITKTTHAPRSGQPSMHQRLWKEEHIRKLLDPATMKSCCLLDPAVLTLFLRKAQENGFAFQDQWSRLLTLEFAVRTLERVRAARPSRPLQTLQ